MAAAQPAERSILMAVTWKGIRLLAVLLILLIGYAWSAQSGELVLPGDWQEQSSHLKSLASDDPAAQEAGLRELAEMGDPASLPLLKALQEGAVYRWSSPGEAVRLVIVERPEDAEGHELLVLLDPVSNQTLKQVEGFEAETLEEQLDRLSISSAEGRRLVKSALDRLKLFDPSAETRRSAAMKIGNEGESSVETVLLKALNRESNRLARHDLEQAVNQLRLASPDPQVRRQAAQRLGKIHGYQAVSKMKSLLDEEPKEQDPAVRGALQRALQNIEFHQGLTSTVGVIFNGLSLGSILFLMGLGLAITFGLMGVINMAHGEMMMIGAYTAFVLQELFAAVLPPSLHDSYFVAALPVSFIVTGAVGLFLEKTVIRLLYGRPLETLLATWGISMILQQAARWYFGDLTSVNAPTWMRGGVEPMVGLVLPYNRIFIIVLGTVGLLGVYLLLSRTRLGLRIRAVTQNRDISACLGISTRRVDGWTFALGTGLAGLAGCSLSLVGSVDPEMGKTYIVESFMVVVVGGVGKLAGTLVSALGIGMLTKILEPIIGGTGGAIYAKLFILAAIILFLQRKPSGLFPAKGRAAETS